MKVIAVMNNKGGVGKSATTSNLAHILATEYGKRVLAVDMDPQGNMSSLYDDMDITSIIQGILYGSLEKKQYMVDDLLLDAQMDPHLCIKKTRYSGLDLIPSFLTLSETEERLKADVKVPQQFRLKAHLEKLEGEYDYCLIDCSPSVSILNINVLAASDEIYMPTRCDAGSVLGLAMTTNLVRTVQSYNPKLKIGGCFFTQWIGRKNVSKVTWELLEDIPLLKLIPIPIGMSKYLEENTYRQLPLLEADVKRESSATQGYLKLAGYILADDRERYLSETAE